MSEIKVGGGLLQVESAPGGSVLFGAFDDRWVQMFLEPGEAVQLSRALVKAAAEALGVTV